MATGFYAEQERFGVPAELRDFSCDIGLGPALVEGICGRIKRFYSGHHHGRMRDELARALVCSKETWYSHPFVHVSDEKLQELRLKWNPESTGKGTSESVQQGLTT